ncbi:unnamed protein product [Lathyrus sativus]|nr:unnamed protein product [Lathyrus sativus]
MMEPGISDHGLLCIKGDEELKRQRYGFKFINKVIDMEGYNIEVTNSWNKAIVGNPDNVMWRKLMRLQHLISKMSKPLIGIQCQIKEARCNLQEAQERLQTKRMNNQVIMQEKLWNENLIELIEIDEQVMSQRAKVDWIRLGDGNNAYFHATLRSKQKIMRIIQLYKEDNGVATNHDDIAMEILKFLWKSYKD